MAPDRVAQPLRHIAHQLTAAREVRAILRVTRKLLAQSIEARACNPHGGIDHPIAHLRTVRTQTQIAVGDTSGIEVEISGYSNGFTGVDLIDEERRDMGDPLPY